MSKFTHSAPSPQPQGLRGHLGCLVWSLGSPPLHAELPPRPRASVPATPDGHYLDLPCSRFCLDHVATLHPTSLSGKPPVSLLSCYSSINGDVSLEPQLTTYEKPNS